MIDGKVGRLSTGMGSERVSGVSCLQGSMRSCLIEYRTLVSNFVPTGAGTAVHIYLWDMRVQYVRLPALARIAYGT